MNYYLFAAYSLVWTALFAYIFALHRKQNEIERKLREAGARQTEQPR